MWNVKGKILLFVCKLVSYLYFNFSEVVTKNEQDCKCFFCSRVKQCTAENQTLIRRIKILQSQNQSLTAQLKRLQVFITTIKSILSHWRSECNYRQSSHQFIFNYHLVGMALYLWLEFLWASLVVLSQLLENVWSCKPHWVRMTA